MSLKVTMSGSTKCDLLSSYLEEKSPWYVQKVRLNQDGCDSFGTYWGIDNLSLYHCFNNKISDYYRAKNRDHAIEQLRNCYKGKNIILLRK